MKKILAFILTFGLIGRFGSPSLAQTPTPTPMPLAYVDGTGGVTQSVNTWVGVSVKEAPFNAYGDGVHNDTAAIQAAINLAAAGTFGNTVFMPTGSYSFTQLMMQTGVVLKGAGWGTLLLQAAGSNEDAIILANTSVQWTVLEDFYLDGGSLRGNTSGNAIHYQNVGGSFIVGDPVQTIRHLLIDNVAGTGVVVDANVRSSHFEDIFVNGANANSFLISCTDSDFIDCVSSASGTSGFSISGDNCRYIGDKSFGSGRVSGGDGFICGGLRNEYSACEAQDNDDNGFHVECFNSAFTSCVADSNAVSAIFNSANGFYLDSAGSNILEGCSSFDRGNNTQDYGLAVHGASTSGNRISMLCTNNVIDSFQNEGGGYPGLDDIRINNQSGMQTLSYGVTMTPEPYRGGTASFVLTGNTVMMPPPNDGHVGSNNHAQGCHLTLKMTQDATGGRVVTWSSGFVINSFSPNTGANKTNTISFIYDGTNWDQVASLISS
jgi:hypothetical protein